MWREKLNQRQWPLAAVILVAAVAVAHAPVLLGFESFYHLDKHALLVPFWDFNWATLRQGEFPSWTPNIRGGFPLLAYGPASQLYPLTYAFLPFFPAHRALDLFTLFHMALGGFFCWMYLRQLTQRHVVALAGALALVLSGRMSGLTIWADAVAAFAFLPLLLWAIDRRSVYGMAAAVGLGFLTGRGQVHLFTVLAGGSYALFRVLELWYRTRSVPRAALVTYTAGFGAGVLLGAAQILPTLALLADSSLGAGVSYEFWALYSLQAKHLSEIFLPGSFPAGWPEAAGYPTMFVYGGILLLVVGLVRARKSTLDGATVFWLVVAAVTMYLAAGGPGAHALTQALPVVRSVRVPARFAIISSVALLSLAAPIWGRILNRNTRWEWILVAVTLLDGVGSAFVSRHTVDAVAFAEPPNAVELVGAQPLDETGSPGRFYSDLFWLWPSDLAGKDADFISEAFKRIAPTGNLAMGNAIRSVRGYGEPRLKWESQPMTLGIMQQMGTRLLFLRRPVDSPGLTRVDFPATDAFVYRVNDPMPRARVVHRLLVVEDFRQASALAANPNFVAEREAVVEVNLASLDPVEEWNVRLEVDRPTHVVFTVESSQPGYLIVSDTWAPGWTATVDGDPQEILRANGRFRLVPIPSGSSTVTFEYVTPGFREGVGLGLVGLLGLALIRVRRKDPDRPSGPESCR